MTTSSADSFLAIEELHDRIRAVLADGDWKALAEVSDLLQQSLEHIVAIDPDKPGVDQTRIDDAWTERTRLAEQWLQHCSSTRVREAFIDSLRDGDQSDDYILWLVEGYPAFSSGEFVCAALRAPGRHAPSVHALLLYLPGWLKDALLADNRIRLLHSWEPGEVMAVESEAEAETIVTLLDPHGTGAYRTLAEAAEAARALLAPGNNEVPTVPAPHPQVSTVSRHVPAPRPARLDPAGRGLQHDG